jgi:hypothetical protein
MTDARSELRCPKASVTEARSELRCPKASMTEARAERRWVKTHPMGRAETIGLAGSIG